MNTEMKINNDLTTIDLAAIEQDFNFEPLQDVASPSNTAACFGTAASFGGSAGTVGCFGTF